MKILLICMLLLIIEDFISFLKILYVRKWKLLLLDMGFDALNSGFAVEISEELKENYKNKSAAHITVSLGEVNGIKGKVGDTGKLKFNKLDETVKVMGRIGYFLSGVGVVLDNSIFN